MLLAAVATLIFGSHRRRRLREVALEELIRDAETNTGYVATARVIARLEELWVMGKVDGSTYAHLRREYENRLEKSK